ncbi:MAG: hypothetical protein H0V40_11540, partial [Actinobacteria bacterium]|nr:hypothetical protein [Actinomycetota bacterium]
MATVTALRAHGRRLVEVEVDGGIWRTLPSEAVVAAGLARGVELDRPRARSLRRELRRLEAIGVAARSLRRRDLSERALEERLGRAG